MRHCAGAPPPVQLDSSGWLGAWRGRHRKSQRSAPAAIVPFRSNSPPQVSASGKSSRQKVWTQSSDALLLAKNSATGHFRQSNAIAPSGLATSRERVGALRSDVLSARLSSGRDTGRAVGAQRHYRLRRGALRLSLESAPRASAARAVKLAEEGGPAPRRIRFPKGAG